MKIFKIILLAIGLAKCASLPEEKAPFKVIKAVSSSTATATKLTFIVEGATAVIFDSIYYQNKITKAIVEGNQVYGSFLNTKRKLDIQLHGDSKQEFGNRPPEKKADFPFEIENNEAIISYKEGEDIKYFKVKNVTEQ